MKDEKSENSELIDLFEAVKRRAKSEAEIFVTVHSSVLADRFHVCMKIWIHEQTKGAPRNEQK